MGGRGPLSKVQAVLASFNLDAAAASSQPIFLHVQGLELRVLGFWGGWAFSDLGCRV